MRLPEGSIWYDLNPEEIIVFSPFNKKPCIYKAKGSVSVKPIEKNFSDSDAFYYWASRTINQEYKSAYNLPQEINQELYLYHKNIKNLDDHFEFSEKTLSHMFRKPHPALEGLSYGERLFECLFEEGFIPGRKGRILEIGAGSGIHTKDLLLQMRKRLPKTNLPISFVSLDLAPGLLKSQQQQNTGLTGKHFFVQADALKIPFADEGFDLIIANEIIADFPVEKVIKAQAAKCGYIKRHKLKIEDAPAEFLINSGAMDFLEELKRVLKPKGKALILEYGDQWAYPLVTELSDHKEYSIHFGHLIQSAKNMGFKTKYRNAFDLFNFDPSVRVITGSCLLLLQRLMKHLNRKLPALAYTEELLKSELGERIYCRIHNLQFQALRELATVFSVQEFKALILKK